MVGRERIQSRQVFSKIGSYPFVNYLVPYQMKNQSINVERSGQNKNKVENNQTFYLKGAREKGGAKPQAAVKYRVSLKIRPKNKTISSTASFGAKVNI